MTATLITSVCVYSIALTRDSDFDNFSLNSATCFDKSIFLATTLSKFAIFKVLAVSCSVNSFICAPLLLISEACLIERSFWDLYFKLTDSLPYSYLTSFFISSIFS